MLSDKELFEKHVLPVPEAGCWLWAAAQNHNGYGVAGNRRGGAELAHRRAWALFKGPVPAGASVLHRCDTPLCVNPDHLFTGSQADNVADMVAKGRARGARGESGGKAVLTEAQAREIRASTESQRVLAVRYGISTATVWGIRTGRNWGHL